MLSQVGLSSKQFISQLGWKEALSPTNSFDELSYHSSHIHKGKKKKNPLAKHCFPTAKFKGKVAISFGKDLGT